MSLISPSSSCRSTSVHLPSLPNHSRRFCQSSVHRNFRRLKIGRSCPLRLAGLLLLVVDLPPNHKTFLRPLMDLMSPIVLESLHVLEVKRVSTEQSAGSSAEDRVCGDRNLVFRICRAPAELEARHLPRLHVVLISVCPSPVQLRSSLAPIFVRALLDLLDQRHGVVPCG
eukprot:8947759-Heterocapsa_arctica.AAC.1